MHTLSIHNGLLRPVERKAIIEEFWASRNAWEDAMNAERRLAWERKWVGLNEGDLPPCHARLADNGYPEPAGSRILPMRRKKEELPGTEAAARLATSRFYWQKAPVPAETLSEAAS